MIAAHNKLGADPRFTDDDLRLAETFAGRAAVAVDLSDRVARDALRRVVEGQELERRRLARELHDETGQALTSILLGLKAIEEASSARRRRGGRRTLRDQIVQTLQDVGRSPSSSARPRSTTSASSRRSSGSRRRSASGPASATVFETRLATSASREVETALYRIVQEALTNVAKHAGAGRVSIVVTRRRGGVTAVVEDDGRGFGAGETRGDGLGLVGMKERVALLGGRLAIESARDEGTALVAYVPVPTPQTTP